MSKKDSRFFSQNLFIGVTSMNKEVLDLTKIDQAESWLKLFKAFARRKGLKDVAASPTDQRDYQVTDEFMSKCGTEAFTTISRLCLPDEVSELQFTAIEKKILEFRQRSFCVNRR